MKLGSVPLAAGGKAVVSACKFMSVSRMVVHLLVCCSVDASVSASICTWSLTGSWGSASLLLTPVHPSSPNLSRA